LRHLLVHSIFEMSEIESWFLHHIVDYAKQKTLPNFSIAFFSSFNPFAWFGKHTVSAKCE